MCACASFTSAPTIFSQVACDVRRLRQFTKGQTDGPGGWLDEAGENVIVADPPTWNDAIDQMSLVGLDLSDSGENNDLATGFVFFHQAMS
jgi:hypothetical protein